MLQCVWHILPPGRHRRQQAIEISFSCSSFCTLPRARAQDYRSISIEIGASKCACAYVVKASGQIESNKQRSGHTCNGIHRSVPIEMQMNRKRQFFISFTTANHPTIQWTIDTNTSTLKAVNWNVECFFGEAILKMANDIWATTQSNTYTLHIIGEVWQQLTEQRKSNLSRTRKKFCVLYMDSSTGDTPMMEYSRR